LGQGVKNGEKSGGPNGSISKSAATLHTLDFDLSSTTPVELVGKLRGDVDGGCVQS
jgi:hypothetical protein